MAIVLHARALGVGFVESDLLALDTTLRTQLGALMRGGALPGGFAPLSRELYWWWWGRIVQLDATALHVLNAVIAVAGAWWLHRAANRWAGPGAAGLAAAAWVAFPPLGTLMAWTSGARELLVVLASAGALAAFAKGRWWVAGLACAWASLSGSEAWPLPLVLVVLDALERPGDRIRARLPRLLPSLVAGGVAALIGAALTSPSAQPIAGMAALTAFARAWMPLGAREGLAATWRWGPWLVLLVFALSLAAVPGRRRAPGGIGSRGIVTVGLALALITILPLAASREPLTSERFAVPALGVCLAAGGLAAASPWIARGLLLLFALTSLGANAAIPAVGASSGPFTSAATLRARSAAIGPLLAALRPWCKDLASAPVSFATGVPPDSLFRLVLERGAPATCRDPRVAVRFLAELTPGDADRPFGLLHLDASRMRFRFERADARVRALVGEGLLLFARHDPAAACFEAAARERPADPELVYPLVSALASAQRFDEAQARWTAAARAGATLSADSLTHRLLTPGGVGDAERREILRLAAAVLAEPTAAAPHLALGRRLLDLGRSRSAALEISVACGIGRRSQDVYWLARAYDAMGASAEALEAYRAALAGGLDSIAYRAARGRLTELLRSMGPGLTELPRP